jgi:hypothetical protein
VGGGGYPKLVIHKTMHDCNKDFIFGINLEKKRRGSIEAMDSNTKTYFKNGFLYGKPNKL